jgi:hypothetical protein
MIGTGLTQLLWSSVWNNLYYINDVGEYGKFANPMAFDYSRTIL